VILSGEMTVAAALSKQVDAWPEHPRSAPREPGCPGPGVEHAFPSGRAAILACLDLAAIGPDDVVATPECVTVCVANAVRRRARPVPVRAAIAGPAGPAAAIVYEQWGWPLPEQAENAIRERLAGVPLIIDRVDSADFFSAPRLFGTFEVVSLSKVLGLDAGGLARRCSDGAFVRFAPDLSKRQAPSAGHPRLISHPAVRELYKQSEFVHPSATHWLGNNCAVAALDSERHARSTAARLILESPLAGGWPDWMAQATELGAGPVWAPVLRGRDAQVHRRAIAGLEHQLGVRAAVRMFNWSGNPLSPRYEPSVALPIHGGLVCPAEAVSVLVRTTLADR